VHIILSPEVGDPSHLAKLAIKQLEQLRKERGRGRQVNSFEERDEGWIVIDRDEHPHFHDAVARCEQAGVKVARSNPCFEVWLILHEEEYHRPDDRHAVQRHYATLRSDYDMRGGKTPDCFDIIRRIEVAEQRADVLLHRREQEGKPFGRPSTTVGWLTQAIRAAAKAAQG